MLMKKTLKLLALTAMALAVLACGKDETEKKGEKKDEPKERENIFGSDLFEEYVDASSGVKSYLLKVGTGGWDSSQSNYFNTRSMTNDERFLFYFGSNDDFVENGVRYGMLIDLKYGKIYKLPNIGFGCCPYLDPDEDVLYYGYTNSDKNRAYFYKRELLVDPSLDIKLKELPSRVVPSDGTRPIKRLANHLTLTQDKKKVFLDMRLMDEFVWGLLDLYTGAWEEWGRAELNYTHGQLNPVRDDIALMAIDSYNKLDGTKVDIPYDADGTYPRLKIVQKGSAYTMKPDMTRDKNEYPGGYASHERWDESGQYVYWSSSGACIRKLSNENDFKKYDEKNGASWSSHCFFSKNNEYITYDDQSLDFYRGCRWKVKFYNIKTKKQVFIYTLLPAMVTRAQMEDKDFSTSMGNLHPDPHPQFVCNDKYIVCTAHTDKAPAMTIQFSITPVDQLINKTK